MYLPPEEVLKLRPRHSVITPAYTYTTVSTTAGDPSRATSRIKMTRDCFVKIMDQLEITPYASRLFTEEMFHLSRHTLYDEETDKPIALGI